MADNKRKYYTKQEIYEMFSWQPQTVSAIACRKGWRSVREGKTRLFNAEDVNKFALARKRTHLLKALGRPGRFYEHTNVFDGACPVCGAFAVFWQKNILAYIDDPKAMYLCDNGHSSQPA
jgi:hypothetical protein